MIFWLFSWFSIHLNPARVEMFCAPRTRRLPARTARPPYPGTPGIIFVSNLHFVSKNHEKLMECVSSLVAIYLSSSFEKCREKRLKVKSSQDTCKPIQIMGLTFTTLRLLAVTIIGDGCRFLNLYWFKNTKQSWMQTSRWCLYAFLTCYRASCLTHDVTRHHHRRVFS